MDDDTTTPVVLEHPIIIASYQYISTTLITSLQPPKATCSRSPSLAVTGTRGLPIYKRCTKQLSKYHIIPGMKYDDRSFNQQLFSGQALSRRSGTTVRRNDSSHCSSCAPACVYHGQSYTAVPLDKVMFSPEWNVTIIPVVSPHPIYIYAVYFFSFVELQEGGRKAQATPPLNPTTRTPGTCGAVHFLKSKDEHYVYNIFVFDLFGVVRRRC